MFAHVGLDVLAVFSLPIKKRDGNILVQALIFHDKIMTELVAILCSNAPHVQLHVFMTFKTENLSFHGLTKKLKEFNIILAIVHV